MLSAAHFERTAEPTEADAGATLTARLYLISECDVQGVQLRPIASSDEVRGNPAIIAEDEEARLKSKPMKSRRLRRELVWPIRSRGPIEAMISAQKKVGFLRRALE